GLGRFVACKQGFYDPEVFAKGREITVTGSLDGTVQHKIGEYDYTYPRVAANTIYLWPKRPIYMQRPDPWGPWGPCDPFWSGWGCGGWGYGPWGFRRRRRRRRRRKAERQPSEKRPRKRAFFMACRAASDHPFRICLPAIRC